MPTAAEIQTLTRKAINLGLALEVEGECYTIRRAGRILIVTTRWRLIRGRLAHYEHLMGREEHW